MVDLTDTMIIGHDDMCVHVHTHKHTHKQQTHTQSLGYIKHLFNH